MRVKRQGLVVWYKHRRQANRLKRYGHLIYRSKKQHYAILYVNMDDIEAVERKLKSLSFVKKVKRSLKPMIQTTYEKNQPMQIKDFDYNLGI